MVRALQENEAILGQADEDVRRLKDGFGW
jgi:hypothetical protein